MLAEVEALPPEARVVEDTPPTSGPLARAEHTREVLSSIPLKLATQDQVSVKRFSVTNFETGAEVVLMDALRQEELWADRIDRLGLTDEQLVLAVKFRDLYLQKLNEIHKERQMIQARAAVQAMGLAGAAVRVGAGVRLAGAGVCERAVWASRT